MRSRGRWLCPRARQRLRQKRRRFRSHPPSRIKLMPTSHPGPREISTRSDPEQGEHGEHERLQEIKAREPAFLNGGGFGRHSCFDIFRLHAREFWQLGRISHCAPHDFTPRGASNRRRPSEHGHEIPERDTLRTPPMVEAGRPVRPAIEAICETERMASANAKRRGPTTSTAMRLGAWGCRKNSIAATKSSKWTSCRAPAAGKRGMTGSAASPRNNALPP